MREKIDMKRLHHGCGEALIAAQLRGGCAIGAVGREQQDLRLTHSKLRFTYARSSDNDPGKRR